MKLKKVLILPLFALALSACSKGGYLKDKLESNPKDTIEDYLEYVQEYNSKSEEFYEKSFQEGIDLIPDLNYLSNGLYMTKDSEDKCEGFSIFTRKTIFSGIPSTDINVLLNDYTGFNVVIKKIVDGKTKYYLVDSFGNKTAEYDYEIKSVSVNTYLDKVVSLTTKNITKLHLSYIVDNKTYTYEYNDFKLEEFKGINEVGSLYYNKNHFEQSLKDYGYEDSTVVADYSDNYLRITYKEKDKEDKIYTFPSVFQGITFTGNYLIIPGFDTVTKYDDYNVVIGEDYMPIYCKTYIEKLNLRKGTVEREYTNILPIGSYVIDKDHYIVSVDVYEKDYEYSKLIVVDEDYKVLDTKINDYYFFINYNNKYSYLKLGDYYYNSTTNYILDKDANVVTSLAAYYDVEYNGIFKSFVCKTNNSKYGLIGYDGKVLTEFDADKCNLDYSFTGYAFMKKSDDYWYQTDSNGQQVKLDTKSLKYYYLDSNKNLKTIDGKNLGQYDKIEDSFKKDINYYDANQKITYYINGCECIEETNSTTKYYLNCYQTKMEVK